MIRALLGQVSTRPTVTMVALEVGAGQAPLVAEMFDAAGFADIAVEPDLAGIERVVHGRRRPA